MFTIYGYGTFNAVKVLLTAEELGADYRYVHVNLGRGEHLTPEYRAKHPLGKIPLLEHEGQRFIESHAICRYLARCHDNRLYATDPATAAKIDGMMDVFGQHLGRWMGVHFWQEVIRPKFLKQDPDADALEEAKDFLEKQLPFVNDSLAEQACLVGDQISIADTIAYAYCQLQEQTSLDFTPYPHIQRWYGEISERPAVARVQALLAKY